MYYILEGLIIYKLFYDMTCILLGNRIYNNINNINTFLDIYPKIVTLMRLLYLL